MNPYLVRHNPKSHLYFVNSNYSKLRYSIFKQKIVKLKIIQINPLLLLSCLFMTHYGLTPSLLLMLLSIEIYVFTPRGFGSTLCWITILMTIFYNLRLQFEYYQASHAVKDIAYKYVWPTEETISHTMKLTENLSEHQQTQQWSKNCWMD